MEKGRKGQRVFFGSHQDGIRDACCNVDVVSVGVVNVFEAASMAGNVATVLFHRAAALL